MNTVGAEEARAAPLRAYPNIRRVWVAGTSPAMTALEIERADAHPN